MTHNYDYRELREIINKNHDRFSPLNFDSSLSLDQQMTSLAEWFKVILKEYKEWVDYLDNFIDKFDENLYTTVYDILDKWIKDGVLTQIVNNALNAQNEKIDKFISDMTKAFNNFKTETNASVDAKNAQLRKDILALLDTKRDKAVKLTNADWDISSDSTKVTPAMLSNAVKDMMTGSTPVSPTPANDSITTQMIATGGVKLKNVVKSLVTGFCVFPNDPNYNMTTDELILPAGVMNWEDGGYLKNFTIQPTTVPMQITGTSYVKLLFDITNKTFRFVSWITSAGEDEIVLMLLYLGSKTAKTWNYWGIFDLKFNNKYPNKTDTIPTAFPLYGGQTFPNYNRETSELVFPSNTNDMIIVSSNGEYYNQVVPAGGKVVDLSPLDTIGSTAAVILFNKATKSFEFDIYSRLANYTTTHLLFATIRVYPSQYIVSQEGQFTVDGRPFGMDIENGGGTVESNVVLNNEFSFIRSVAHRGWNEGSPEQTDYAYREAKKHGVKYVECDVQFTSDGTPILLHDNTINRTARNADGSVIETQIDIQTITLAQAKTYDFGIAWGSQYAGQKIMTLEEFIILCKKLDLIPYIELKRVGDTPNYQKIYDVTKKYGMEKICYFMGSYATASIVGSFDQKARLVCLTSPITQDLVTQIKTNWVEAQGREVVLNTNEAQLTESICKMVVDAGLKLECWTLTKNQRERINNLVSWGVTGITSNNINITEFFLNE